MALIKEYFELTKKYQDEYGENTILLMQVGSFFEVYGIYSEITKAITGARKIGATLPTVYSISLSLVS
jgi:DNA mismatch repair protein MutS